MVWCHLIPASPKSVVRPEKRTVTVDNMADLILNLRDNVEILLEPGTYNVSEYLTTHPDDVGDWTYITNEAYAWGVYDQGFDEPELLIAGLKDVTIRAAKPGELTEIVCEPRHANVLSFQNCSGITLEGVTMGHTPEPGTCSGSVLNLMNCMSVTLKNVDLYGCGAYGITSYGSYYISMDDSVIRECTYGCISMNESYGLFFTGDTFRDCDGFTMLELYNASATFENCSFSGLKGSFLSAGEYSYINFTGCDLEEEYKAFVEGLPYFGTQIIVDWESSSSAKG